MIERIKDLMQALVGADGYALLASAAWWLYPVVNERSFHWIFLVSFVVIALIVYLLGARRGASERSGFLGFIVPRRVYAHPSAILDYKFYVINQLAVAHLQIGGWVIALAGVLNLSQWVPSLLALGFGPAAADRPMTTGGAVAFSVAMVLAVDFARFFAHYLMHRNRVLWEFHKVHHAAEVLTPITSFRAHPVEIVLDLCLRIALTAGVVGVFRFFYAEGLTEITILNFGVISFFYYLTNHFRHSHIPIGYGRAVSQVLISPVMHQLHHSADRRHFDRNFGFIFTFWDRVAGTHLVPARGEQFVLGLPPDAGRFDSLWALYALPVARAFGWRDPVPASNGGAVARSPFCTLGLSKPPSPAS